MHQQKQKKLSLVKELWQIKSVDRMKGGNNKCGKTLQSPTVLAVYVAVGGNASSKILSISISSALILAKKLSKNCFVSVADVPTYKE